MRLSKVREEAANLCSALANYPEQWQWTTVDCPGNWSKDSRRLAELAWDRMIIDLPHDKPIPDDHEDWFAEAEALIRDGSVR